jgi:hypothetical protein
MKHVTISETDDATAAMRDARRNVALAKLSQFETECVHLGAIASRNPHRKQELVDCLYDVSVANKLASIHGGGLIEELIAAGFAA